MPKRSDSKRIGSAGERLVELLIEKSGNLISRRQTALTICRLPTHRNP